MRAASLFTVSRSIRWGGLPNAPLDADPPPDADPLNGDPHPCEQNDTQV